LDRFPSQFLSRAARFTLEAGSVWPEIDDASTPSRAET
jgi:hypothetical protein